MSINHAVRIVSTDTNHHRVFCSGIPAYLLSLEIVRVLKDFLLKCTKILLYKLKIGIQVQYDTTGFDLGGPQFAFSANLERRLFC